MLCARSLAVALARAGCLSGVLGASGGAGHGALNEVIEIVEAVGCDSAPHGVDVIFATAPLDAFLPPGRANEPYAHAVNVRHMPSHPRAQVAFEMIDCFMHLHLNQLAGRYQESSHCHLLAY
jgi:hypothetical protein